MGKRPATGDQRPGSEKKRDGNTEFTEIGTQRAQRREAQEKSEEKLNAETQRAQRRETKEHREEKPKSAVRSDCATLFQEKRKA